jgi:N-acyl homoserine lactone hydrolase
MDGDFDVFGDGSVKVISTPGHCSLQVRLPKAGPILLSGDVAHYRFNLEHRCGRP